MFGLKCITRVAPDASYFFRFLSFGHQSGRRGSCEGVLGGGESQRHHSTVLSHSSSESSRLTLGKSIEAAEFRKC